MKIVAIFVLGFAALSAAKPTIEREKSARSAIESLIRELVGSTSLSHEARTRPKMNPFLRSESEEEMCDVKLGIIIPCLNMTEESEFFDCAIQIAQGVEQTFAKIYKDESGEDLFRYGEMEKIWEIRTSSLVARQFKEFVEVVVDELGYYRFTDKVEWDDLTKEVQDEIEELMCTYKIIRDACYKRME